MTETHALTDTPQPRKSLKGALIADLKIGTVAVLQAAAVEKQSKTTKAGKPFLDLMLSDKSGRINAKVWDNAEELAKKFDVESIIQIEAEVSEWEKSPQLTIRRLRPCKPEEIDLADFTATTPLNIDHLWDGLEAAIGDVKDERIHHALDLMAGKLNTELRTAPAAMKFHHSYIGGLLEHCVSMLQAADLLCQHYDRLNKDLLIAGIILHDIGKVRELSAGIKINYTDSGSMVGHLAHGLLILEKYGDDLPAETKMQLQHLICSHHGQKEWGAIVEPMTPEAIALHCLDLLDSRLWQAWHAIDGTTETWTAWESGRIFYRGPREAGAQA